MDQTTISHIIIAYQNKGLLFGFAKTDETILNRRAPMKLGTRLKKALAFYRRKQSVNKSLGFATDQYINHITLTLSESGVLCVFI